MSHQPLTFLRVPPPPAPVAFSSDAAPHPVQAIKIENNTLQYYSGVILFKLFKHLVIDRSVQKQTATLCPN